ncbi:NAD(P)H-dependent flavin oxidoreductase YrpB, nitropropane dioxygenase family [Pseudonocardia ammonioxydans]|uniref:NAD(P)H-dependent flavin oxidoreductase YrpB, nitropropane dioxygenase family n=1 Tax=Pseudonocardia ammonioxydans TaxID=260086 RepID=A0A1I5H934_PSUAM|nr:nitronate monooxygenase [Pseudonocardia ammonioxydans]SFO44717.1 NAD(P)H-dependent flavin oxidoreductase YrpB, nitropropane dioxygenase family [Pseudonocardia ammonioxydans]
MVRTALTNMLGIEAPLVGFNRSPAVVAEVSNAGGFGVLGASTFTPAELDAALSWIEEQVGGRPYGVDVLVPGHTAQSDPADLIASLRAQIPQGHRDFVEGLLERYGIPELPAGTPTVATDEIASALATGGGGVEALLDVAFSHRISLVANALGPPPPELVSRAKAAGVPVAGLVGQGKHVANQLEAGVDVLIAQGTEAGGHTGTVATMVLTPEVIELAGSVPVLAAGGIASGPQMAAALALGAAGVWCGSVWLSSTEEVTGEAVKRKYLEATSADTVRSPTRTGKPARQLRTAWHDEWDTLGAPSPLPMPLQPMLVQDAWNRIDAAADAGNEDARALESFFIGQVVGGFRRLRPTAEITREIIADCEARLHELARLTATPGEP